MNWFVAKRDGLEMAYLADDVTMLNMWPDLVIALVRHGAQMSYETPASSSRADEARIAVARPALTKLPAPTPCAARKKPKAKAKAAATGDVEGFALGDTVYLNWPELADYLRVSLSSYRLVAGEVVEFRKGQGVRKKIGVRFNSDPELTWLASAELGFTIPIASGG